MVQISVRPASDRLHSRHDQYLRVPTLPQREDRPIAQRLHEQEQRERCRPVGEKLRTAQEALDESGDEPQGVQGDYEGVVSPSPLDGAFRARLAFVAAGQDKLQETLRGYESHSQDENCGSAQHQKKISSTEKPSLN